jgi:hypothetical protein
MLLREDGDAVVAIGQASHAWLSGQLARAWGGAAVAAFSPHEAVCLGAEQHDVGMAHWDLAPALNPDTGLPQSFLEMPIAVHLALWSAAPARLLSQSRYAALLVSLHGTALYGRGDLARFGAAADDVRAYLAGQRALQARLAAELGAGPDELRRNQQLLFAWDWLSLALCLRWPEGDGPPVPLAAGDTGPLHLVPREGGAVLTPWPFTRDIVRVTCEGRRLEGRFAREPELHAALERAPRVELAFDLRPV